MPYKVTVSGRNEAGRAVSNTIIRNAVNSPDNLEALVNSFQPLVTYKIQKAVVTETQDTDFSSSTVPAGEDYLASTDVLHMDFSITADTAVKMSYNNAATFNPAQSGSKTQFENNVRAFAEQMNENGLGIITQAYLRSSSDTSISLA